MKTIGIILAVLMHGGFILFGGLVFNNSEQKENHGTVQEVIIESNMVTAAAKKEEPKETADRQAKEENKPEDERPPDPELQSHDLILSAAASSPELSPLGLNEIQLILGKGLAGAGDFGPTGGFQSGVIGGKGPRGSAIEKKMEEAFRLDEMDQKPRPVFQATPAYPSEMRGKRAEGAVTLLFVVDTSGKVANPRVEKSNEIAFEQPALNAVRQWKFEPGIKGGQKAACRMRVTVRFPKS